MIKHTPEIAWDGDKQRHIDASLRAGCALHPEISYGSIGIGAVNLAWYWFIQPIRDSALHKDVEMVVKSCYGEEIDINVLNEILASAMRYA